MSSNNDGIIHDLQNTTIPNSSLPEVEAEDSMDNPAATVSNEDPENWYESPTVEGLFGGISSFARSLKEKIPNQTKNAINEFTEVIQRSATAISNEIHQIEMDAEREARRWSSEGVEEEEEETETVASKNIKDMVNNLEIDPGVEGKINDQESQTEDIDLLQTDHITLINSSPPATVVNRCNIPINHDRVDVKVCRESSLPIRTLSTGDFVLVGGEIQDLENIAHELAKE